MSADSSFDPENRELYTALVRAPDGYRFGHAVATTYSLDFETALAIPISIVFRDAENRDEMLRSPLALLQSVERMADRIAVYCDRGRIKEAHPNAARLMALYEKTIVEVAAPGGGAFHPKLWCIRFEPEKKTDPVRMRVAILSRNLTNDRCWDLALALDGAVHDEENENNRALTKLLRALPRLANPATRPAPPKFLPSMISDLERTWWEGLPAGATKVSFAVNGLDGDGWALPRGEKLAVLSPFVSAPALKRLSDGYGSRDNLRLVSRAEELDCIGPETRELFTISTLDERATEYEAEGVDGPSSADLEGLHAKAYLVERGSRLQIHLGSANATTAAMIPTKRGKTQNVEVMATLDGPKTRMGTIDDVLFSEAFQRLLATYTPSEPPTQDAAMAAEKALEKMRSDISALPLDLHCSEEDDLIHLELQIATKEKHVLLPDGVRCFVRAITVPNERGYDVGRLLCGSDTELAMGAVPLGDVTRWLGIRLLDEATKVELTFTLGARLVGVPEGRDAAVLRAHIANVGNFFRYLSLLLGTLGEGSFLESDTGGEGQWLRRLGEGNTSLLEPMVRALSLESGELEEIGRLIERLEDPDGGETIVPKEFLALWQSFKPLVTSKRGRR
ncbi:phospholipase D family protein [Agrobacterium sp.]|nr:phospholipase D family protein [Agrobacterium sp.]MEA3263455.1 phospholipase D family protein [Pseudomonadota bacterium]